MKLSLLLAAMLFAGVAHADADFIPRDEVSGKCEDAVLEKLAADDGEIGGFMSNNPYSVGLEWYNNEKTQISFTIQFGEDVRDGYAVGQINVKLNPDKSCKVGAIDDYSVGD